MIRFHFVRFTLLISFAAANDGWEYHGGRRKRRAHGFNSATKEQAPRRKGAVRYEERITESKPEILITSDEAPPAPIITSNGSNDRSSLRNNEVRTIKGKKDVMLLPDRLSVLNFDRNESEEHRDTKEVTMESSWWGRLFVEGFPSAMQYFRAHFGIPPPEGDIKLLLASPIDMCDDKAGLAILKNSNEVDNATVIVAMRGSCTFGEKAVVAHEYGAAGIVFVNNEQGNFHISGPVAHDLQISAVMISLDEGFQLIRALERVQAANGPWHVIKGRYVALVCGNENGTFDHMHSYCQPVQASDEAFVASLNYKGKMSIEGNTFDYLQGEFGAWIDETAEWITVVPSVIGVDPYCCEREGFEGNGISRYHAILCQRGECEFITKANHIESIGAGMLIVSSYNETLHRMGVDPPHTGRKLSVATAMVAKDSFEHMVDTYYTQLDFGLPSILLISLPNFRNDTCGNMTER